MKIPHRQPHLVASFKATLEETVNADLLLHVVNASSPEAFEQIETTLGKNQIAQVKRLGKIEIEYL